MRRACKEGAVARSVALEREESMRWLHNERYVALVDNLAAAGNPEACFLRGLTLVFAKRCMQLGIQCLTRAADAGHKVAAYVLAVLHYCYWDKQEAERYIRQVEGEGGVDHGCKQASGRTNRKGEGTLSMWSVT
jgi:hypothetical protein